MVRSRRRSHVDLATTSPMVVRPKRAAVRTAQRRLKPARTSRTGSGCGCRAAPLPSETFPRAQQQLSGRRSTISPIPSGRTDATPVPPGFKRRSPRKEWVQSPAQAPLAQRSWGRIALSATAVGISPCVALIGCAACAAGRRSIKIPARTIHRRNDVPLS